MKTCSITICLFYLFGMAAAHQNVESTIALDNSFEDAGDTEDHELTFFEDVDATEDVDMTDNINKVGEETHTQRYMRGYVSAVDNDGETNRNLVAKGGTYVVAKGGDYVTTAKGKNVVAVAKKLLCIHRRERETTPLLW
eukprot:71400_1